MRFGEDQVFGGSAQSGIRPLLVFRDHEQPRVLQTADDHVTHLPGGLTTRGTALQSELSGVEEVDMAEMAMKVTTANTNYQAALQTTATISQISLMDFLR